ncbi:MAG TPA: FtsX-like permease family protein [Gemmatimonadales bacterium]|nr:FtsX-like permease family protein [Gemmatimonadales bacterium]
MLHTAILLSISFAVPQQSGPAPRPEPIAIERRVAERLGLRVGDTVSVGLEVNRLEARAVVAAIYEPTADPSAVARRDLTARFHLPYLARLLGAPDRVDRFAIAVDSGVEPAVAAGVLNRAAFGFRAFPSREIASESSETFRVVDRFHRAIGVISVVASAIFLLCIMLLKVEERRVDAAVMRLTGISRRTVFLALLIEAVLIATVGSVMGVALAEAASATTNAYYQRFFDTTLVFSIITSGILRFSVALSIGLGLLAGALAARRLVKTAPMVLWGRGAE